MCCQCMLSTSNVQIESIIREMNVWYLHQRVYREYIPAFVPHLNRTYYEAITPTRYHWHDEEYGMREKKKLKEEKVILQNCVMMCQLYPLSPQRYRVI